MRLAYSVFFVFTLLPAAIYSQTYSEIIYDAGTLVEVQTGADVCATNIIVNGSFSGGGTFCSGPLPVTLSEFSASINKNNVKLFWKTEIEQNNSGFDLERKTKQQGSSWIKIAFIRGGGTTNEPKSYSYEDKKLLTGIYKYRLKQIDFNGNYEYYTLESDVSVTAPFEFGISQNYPNPSNPKSKIDFQLPVKTHVKINVYNLLGQLAVELINEVKEAGYYIVEFDGSNLSSGTYFYRIITGDYSETKKIILVK